MAGAGGTPEVAGAGDFDELTERLVLDHEPSSDIVYYATSPCRNVAVRIVLGSVQR